MLSGLKNISLILCLCLSLCHQAAALPASISGDFDKTCTVTLQNGLEVERYVSRRTGLRVVVAKVEGPMVSGYFTFATEEHSDDGLPHTLEHLVFLGSELYPYKGVLDLLANKCIASGTNAWTAVDSTTYTLETAGSEGFLNLLPVYLDHLLYPTLTESGFTTEVYHITGEGEDAGVVYSEMQGSAFTSNDKTFHALVRNMYPATSGYRYDTGGSVENLRNSTNHEKVKAYHKAFYRPENLQLVIAGQMDMNELLKTVHKYEDRIVEKGPRPPFTRPWLSDVPRLNHSVTQDVLYPSSQEENGKLLVAFRGPSMIQDYYGLLAFKIFLQYLTYTSVSPLPLVFVDSSKPLASSVGALCMDYKESTCYFQFSGVDLTTYEKVEKLLYSTLEDMYDGNNIDLSSINEAIEKKLKRMESRLESRPRSVISNTVIDFGVYGDTCEQLEDRMNTVKLYEELLHKPIEFWRDLIKEYILDPHKIVLRIRPSIAEAARVAKENKERLEKRKAALGKDGLSKMAEKLEDAKRKNEIPPPPAMLNDMPIPSTDAVSFHPLDAYSNVQTINNQTTNFKSNPPGFDINKLPFKLQFDDVHTSYVIVTAIMDTSVLSSEQKLYLPLLLDLIFESDVFRNGTEVPYTEVVKDISRHFLASRVGTTLSLGGGSTFSCGSFCSYAMLLTKMEISKYEAGMEWIYDVMYHSKFTVSRLKVIISKYLKSITTSKQTGTVLLNLMMERLLFAKDSIQNQVNLVRQEQFLTDLLAKLKNERDSSSEIVIDELQTIWSILTKLENITFHMSANAKKLADKADINQPWNRFIEHTKVKNMGMETVTDNEFRVNSFPEACQPKLRINEHNSTVGGDKNVIFLNVTNTDKNIEGIDCSKTAYVKGMPSLESSFLQQSTPCVNDYLHEEVPALLAGITYFIQLEGPMWREIRGKGLAYSYGITFLPSEGTLKLKLIKAAQLVNAYKETLKLLNGYINGSTVWDPILLDTAKSSTLYGIINRESTVEASVQQSLFSYFRGVPHSYNKDLLSKVSKVTLPEVQRVIRKYFSKLLSPTQSSTVVVCPKGRVEEVQTAFTSLGHEVQIVEELEKVFD